MSDSMMDIVRDACKPRRGFRIYRYGVYFNLHRLIVRVEKTGKILSCICYWRKWPMTANGFRIGFCHGKKKFGICLFWKTREACPGRSFWGWK